VSDQPLPSPPSKPGARTEVRPIVRLWRLTRKELRETLRDRRTIITLVLMPLLVYPLLSVAFRQFFFSTYSKATDIEWRIAGNNDETLSKFGEQLREGGQLIQQIDGEEQDLPKVLWFTNSMLEEAVRKGDIDLGVRSQFVPSPDLPDGGQLQFDLFYQPDSALSRTIVDYVERRLWAFDLEEPGRAKKHPHPSPHGGRLVCGVPC